MARYRMCVAGLALASLVGPALAGGVANTSQNGSYSFTQVYQRGGRTVTITRPLDERSFNNTRQDMQAVSAFWGRGGGRPGRALAGCSGPRGRGNTATLEQSGTGNAASINQRGENDSAAVQQAGQQNAAYLLQFGNDQQAAAAQRGDHNVAFVVQGCR